MQTTIYALSSAPGRAGVAIIRVSGPASGEAINTMAGPRPAPRLAALRALRHPESGARLDQAVVLWFPAPHSFTGEDVAEFHVHGGRAVIEAVLGAIGDVPGTRMAEAGEFARRAFENGKLDLTAAEGLADLIDAQTEAQRKQALRQAGGDLARLYDGWRSAIIALLAEIEADLDFTDEADVTPAGERDLRTQVARMEADIRAHLDDGRRGEIMREGFRVTIAGPVNAGKSSLLNTLAQREAAIVSNLPGTTRDVVEVRLDIGGYPVLVEDTAGLRAATTEIEAEGIRRTLGRAREADLVIWLFDISRPEEGLPTEVADRSRALIVANKLDLAGPCGQAAPPADLAISVRTGEGLGELTARIAAMAADRLQSEGEPPPTRARHRRELQATADALRAFLDAPAGEPELRCEDLRRAATQLGRVTGRIDVEDVLDRIFAQFCIGK